MRKDLLKELEVIAIKRRGAIYLPEAADDNNVVSFAGFLKEITNYGFYLDVFDESVISAFKNGEVTEDVLTHTMNAMKHAFDLHEGAVVLYPNFPEEVEETDELKLFIDAVIYAITGFTALPEKNAEYNRLLDDYISQKDLKSLTFIHNEDMIEIFWNIASSTTALSLSDKDDMNVLLDTFSEEIAKTAKNHEIPFKETMAELTVRFAELNLDSRYLMKTPTDLLRVLQYLEERRTDLKGRFRLPTFTKFVKKLIVTTLESMPFNVEDVMRYREEWKHIFRFIKGVDIVENYKDYLYRNKRFQGFYSKEDELFTLLENGNCDLDSYLHFLSARPSELLRRVDKVLRLELDDDDVDELCEYVTEAVAKTERRVSYQLLNHLNRRSDARGVFYSGMFHALENHERIDEETMDKVRKAIYEGLIQNFRANKELVIVDRSDYYKDIPVMTSNRLAGENFQGLIPGMRIKFDDKYKYLRLFTSWGMEYRDIDLSAVAIKNGREYATCAYYELKTHGMTHSGDVRKGPGKEFIDVDLERLRKDGVDYIIMQNYNYSGGTMHKIKSGIMALEKNNRQKGSIYKANEVLLSSFLASDTSSAVSLILDVNTNEVIWIDSPVEARAFSNFAINGDAVLQLIRYYQADKLDVQTVFDIMHEAGVLIYTDELKEDDEKLEKAVSLVELKEDSTLAVKQDLLNKITN